MTTTPYAFVSYQTEDKQIAGALKKLLASIGISAFLAHEDIEVSEEWRKKILEEIEIAEIFICLLSKNYMNSYWCIQEAGIAAFRRGMTIIPLSIDGTIPQGFLSHIQSVKIKPDSLSITDLIPGLFRHDYSITIQIIIDIIRSSRSYRGAEVNFQLILPHLEKLSSEQGKSLLEGCVKNGQVHDAGLCANVYIPQALKLFGNTLSDDDRKFLEETCRNYGAAI